ncbi:ABC transporter substrate-binding protein [Pseudoruegeria sp. HB172150]|uniref:CmpA/NrtA family ABC transporter substrate-binding protein n=1 Tax=Pseudoruegeria sp. HB172150 TaxID=2721164 RepID=UPI001553681A
MTPTRLSVGFIPLIDAVPLIAAQEMGFAGEEGITLDLVAAPSWSSLRDMLVFGRVQAAHMLAPVPVAAALGLGGTGSAISAVSVLSVNGNTIGVSRELAARLRGAGHDFGFHDATAAGRALIAAAPAPLRIGVPFPFSMHAELLYYWLSALGLPAPQGVDIKTVPPPLMADAIAAGEIDAFCVGAPWGSIAVEQGVGELLLPTSAIWSFAPEKVLAVRTDWATAEEALLGRLIRAVWRAGRWLDEPGTRSLAAEILSRPEYLNVDAEILDRGLTGSLTISPAGDMREVPGFMEFHRGAAGFPWRSQAEWIALQLAARTGLDRTTAGRAGRTTFRSDIYRAALGGTKADLPGASSKLEGALEAETAVASESGRLFLRPNLFFDRRIFDPDAPV